MNTKEQIKEMKERWEEYFELHKHKEAITGSILIEWRDVYHFLDKELPNLLNTEVQKAREEAVRGLQDRFEQERLDGHMPLGSLDIEDIIDNYIKELR